MVRSLCHSGCLSKVNQGQYSTRLQPHSSMCNHCKRGRRRKRRQKKPLLVPHHHVIPCIFCRPSSGRMFALLCSVLPAPCSTLLFFLLLFPSPLYHLFLRLLLLILPLNSLFPSLSSPPPYILSIYIFLLISLPCMQPPSFLLLSFPLLSLRPPKLPFACGFPDQLLG